MSDPVFLTSTRNLSTRMEAVTLFSKNKELSNLIKKRIGILEFKIKSLSLGLNEPVAIEPPTFYFIYDQCNLELTKIESILNFNTSNSNFSHLQ